MLSALQKFLEHLINRVDSGNEDLATLLDTLADYCDEIAEDWAKKLRAIRRIKREKFLSHRSGSNRNLFDWLDDHKFDIHEFAGGRKSNNPSVYRTMELSKIFKNPNLRKSILVKRGSNSLKDIMGDESVLDGSNIVSSINSILDARTELQAVCKPLFDIIEDIEAFETSDFINNEKVLVIDGLVETIQQNAAKIRSTAEIYRASIKR